MLKKIGWLATSMMLTACVTINIYFPAAAAEEAARTIVRDVLDVGDQAPEQPIPEDQDSQKDKPTQKQGRRYRYNRALVMVGKVLEFVVPSAHAASAANIDINTPAINKLRKSMDARQRKLSPYYRSGAVGFDQQGKVSIRNLGEVALKDKNQLKKLVVDENKDRDALYREIARANKHPEWEADIRNTFARIWIEEAPKGYWYKQGGAWKKK